MYSGKTKMKISSLSLGGKEKKGDILVKFLLSPRRTRFTSGKVLEALRL
jgi:hypothetical protein